MKEPLVLMGNENEYLVLALGELAGEEWSPERLGRGVLELLAARVPAVKDETTGYGYFLANGCRVYLDNSVHVEIATATHTSPRSLLIQEKAADNLMTWAVRQLNDRYLGLHAVALKRTTDVLLTPESTSERTLRFRFGSAAAGAHENFSVQSPISHERLVAQLLPYLIARNFFAGSGAPSLEHGYVLSQRLPFIEQTSSANSPKAMIRFRDDDRLVTGNQFWRVHLTSKDMCLSQHNIYLNAALTGLVLLAISRGSSRFEDLMPEEPLHAAAVYGADFSGRTTVRAKRGRLSATDVLESYCEEAEHLVRIGDAPEWASEALAAFEWLIEALRSPDPQEKLRPVLEAYFKRALLEEFLTDRNLTWDDFKRYWRSEIIRLEGGTVAARPRPYEQACRTLLQYDLQYHQLGEEGLYEELTETGMMQDHLVSGEDITAAMEGSMPGLVERDRLRCEVIGRLAHREQFVARWERICNRDTGECLDLGNPFERTEHWHRAA